MIIKPFFVCHQCRASCSNGEDEVGVYGPDRCPAAYTPRKQEIGCLGPLCDRDFPCELQAEKSDVTEEQWARLVAYLTVELNKFLIKPSKEDA